MSGGHTNHEAGRYERDFPGGDGEIGVGGEIESCRSAALIARQRNGRIKTIDRNVQSYWPPPPFFVAGAGATGFLNIPLTSRVPRSMYDTPLSIHSGRGLPSR